MHKKERSKENMCRFACDLSNLNIYLTEFHHTSSARCHGGSFLVLISFHTCETYMVIETW